MSGTYGLDPQQLLQYVVRPTLLHIGLHSRAAEQLLLGTALTESYLKYLRQLGGGPAIGLCQMEPATHDDIWRNYLRYKPELAARISDLATAAVITAGAQEMAGNLYYAFGMCRVHYDRARVTIGGKRVQLALPAANAFGEMAHCWKQFYNTPLGAGTVAKALPHFQKACELE